MPRGHRDWGQVPSGLQSIHELPTYIASNSGPLAMGTGKPLLSLFNPAGSGTLVRLRHVLISPVYSFGAALNQAVYELRRTTALGTGTAVTPVRTDLGDAASSCTAAENLTVAPGFGDRIRIFTSWSDFNNVAGHDRFASIPPPFFVYFNEPGQSGKALLLRQGEGICINPQAGSANVNLTADAEYTEEPV